MLFSTPLMTVYLLFIAAVIGMCAGSFTLCAASRSAAGESFMKGRSHCDACGHTLGIAELIPIISFIVFRGRCHFCKTKLSPVYPCSEAAAAAVFILLTLRLDATVSLAQFMLVASALIYITIYDIKTLEIQNGAILFLIITRLAFIPLLSFEGMATGINGFLKTGSELLISSVIGALTLSVPVLIISLIMEHILKKEAMGGGDIKLFFAIGMFFPWQHNIFLLIMSCIVGICFAVISALLSPDTEKNNDEAINEAGDLKSENTSGTDTDEDAPPKNAFPFGPSIAAAAIITVLAAEPFIGWYMSLFKI